MTTVETVQPLASRDRAWGAGLLVGAVIAAVLTVAVPFGVLAAVLVAALAGWRLTRTTRFRALLWVALGVAVAALVLGAIVTIALLADTV